MVRIFADYNEGQIAYYGGLAFIFTQKGGKEQWGTM